MSYNDNISKGCIRMTEYSPLFEEFKFLRAITIINNDLTIETIYDSVILNIDKKPTIKELYGIICTLYETTTNKIESL